MPLPANTRERLQQTAEEVQYLVASGKFETTLSPEVQALVLGWKFGKTGYTTPTNIFLTASWYKWLDNDQDIRNCFVKDSTGANVPNSYSGRGTDESFTVPLVAEFSISQRFCSPNSGFQGSRAIEKVKLPLTIENYTDIRVSWDTERFFQIIALIQNSSSAQSHQIFRFLLSIAFNIQAQIAEERADLMDTRVETNELTAYRIITNKIHQVRDPQFHKIVVGAYYSLSLGDDFQVTGFEDSITGADARSGSAGDFSIWRNNALVEGIEVKDNTIQFDYRHINTARNRIIANPTMTRYTMVTTGKDIVSEIAHIDRIYNLIDGIFEETGCLIRLINLRVLLAENWGQFNMTEYLQEITRHLGNENIPDIREGTIAFWMNLI
ncbi:MAG: hypothetical protein ACPHX8_08515 [Candidatus Poseidoniaceae archaeon]